MQRLIIIAGPDLLILGVAYILEGNGFNAAVVSWAIAAVGLVTYVGSITTSDPTTKVSTRFALTAAISAVWFASVGALLFYKGQAGPLSTDAFQSISVVMGVVVAFYFGAQAYEAVGVARAAAAAGAVPAASAESVTVLD